MNLRNFLKNLEKKMVTKIQLLLASQESIADKKIATKFYKQVTPL